MRIGLIACILSLLIGISSGCQQTDQTANNGIVPTVTPVGDQIIADWGRKVLPSFGWNQTIERHSATNVTYVWSNPIGVIQYTRDTAFRSWSQKRLWELVTDKWIGKILINYTLLDLLEKCTINQYILTIAIVKPKINNGLIYIVRNWVWSDEQSFSAAFTLFLIENTQDPSKFAQSAFGDSANCPHKFF